jgi:hypothetical protein
MIKMSRIAKKRPERLPIISRSRKLLGAIAGDSCQVLLLYHRGSSVQPWDELVQFFL